MPAWAPHRRHEQQLREIESELIAAGTDTGLAFERACLLHRLGRTAEAKAAYLAILATAPSHRGTLNNLGTLLYNTGFRSAARTLYTQAVAQYPTDPMGHVNLANLLLEDCELDAARQHYAAALQFRPAHREAHQGLANVLTELGDAEAAAAHYHAAFERRPLLTLPYTGKEEPVSVLLLVSTTRGNIPLRHLLPSDTFLIHAFFAEFHTPGVPLPPYHLIFNSIGDADLCNKTLTAARILVDRATVPVINHPARVMHTCRAENAERLAHIPGVVTAKTAVISHRFLAPTDAAATLFAHGFVFPLLLRAPGFHTGQHFHRVENADGLCSALAGLPGKELIVIEYLDARGADGKWRKYRVMTIDGELYPLHLAISSHWKVHYFTSETADSAAHRAEEISFLTDMTAAIGARAVQALKEIAQTLGLDYGGIDFGVNADGNILFFEANATMVVLPPREDPPKHRHAAFDRIERAVREMLLNRASC